MQELIWINGEVMALEQARVSVEDRGYQFADGVYEVVRVYGGRMFAAEAHLARLGRSAQGIGLALPMPLDTLGEAMAGLVRRCGMGEGMVYVQLTRGTAPRNHVFGNQRPNLLFYGRALPALGEAGEGEGVKLWPVEDERWKRCWIKSIALLANVLAKNEAVSRGYDEAVFVEEGVVSECSASNVFAVKDGVLLTHPAGAKVLAGITRAVILEVAGALGIAVEERAVSEREMMSAEEVFISSTTREINWVSRWGEREVGSGACGAITLRLHRALKERVARETGVGEVVIDEARRRRGSRDACDGKEN